MEFGREIEVNGVRPAWLKDGQTWQWTKGCPSWTDKILRWYDGGSFGYGLDTYKWDDIISIRLPATHPAYIALDKGYQPWSGGDGPPEDYDGGGTIDAGGNEYSLPTDVDAPNWMPITNDTPYGGKLNIIGYRKRAHPVAEEDNVTIKRLSVGDLAEARKAYFEDNKAGDDSAMFYARRWGIIREETTAERFTRETGFEVTDAVRAALEWERK